MLLRRKVLLLLIALAITFSSAALWAYKEFLMPKAANANTYASKDAHPNEKVAAAVDLYNTAPKNDIFITDYKEEGILPVLLIISNDGDQPIELKNMQARFVTAQHAKLEALEVEDVYRRVAHIKGSSNPRPVGPIILPGSEKNKKAQQQYQEITRAHFSAQAVEPHATRSGFLFFDVREVKQAVAGAHIYLTGLRDNSGNEMMYFEIPVTAANAAAGVR